MQKLFHYMVCVRTFITDPQKPMKVEPGIYPLNGADENAVVVTTVDFALTYFVVSGELERSGVPLNLVINDAGGLSVLTSWAAGKFSGNSISAYIKENVEPKVKSRKLIIPGKVAVLKGDLEAKLPGWEIIVGPREAVQLVKFLKDMQADGQIYDRNDMPDRLSVPVWLYNEECIQRDLQLSDFSV